MRMNPWRDNSEEAGWVVWWLSLDSKKLKSWQVHGSQVLGPARPLCAGLDLQTPAFSLSLSGKSWMTLDYNPDHGTEREKSWLARGKGQIAWYFPPEICPRTCVTAKKSHRKACGLPRSQWLIAAPSFCCLCGLESDPFVLQKISDTFLPSELQTPTRVDQVGCILQAALELRG